MWYGLSYAVYFLAPAVPQTHGECANAAKVQPKLPLYSHNLCTPATSLGRTVSLDSAELSVLRGSHAGRPEAPRAAAEWFGSCDHLAPVWENGSFSEKREVLNQHKWYILQNIKIQK